MKKLALSLFVVLTLAIAFLFSLRNDADTLKIISGQYFDLKLRLKPKAKPKNKIVVIAIDESSLQTIGRWPWDRNYMAFLANQILEQNPKSLAFDIVFAEAQTPIPEELVDYLQKTNQSRVIDQYRFDEMLSKAIRPYEDRVILGWFSDYYCYANENCESTVLSEFDPFFLQSSTISSETMEADTLYLPRVIAATTNTPIIQRSALHNGFFVTEPDPDGTLRRQPLVMRIGDKLYPSLAMASLSVDPQTKELRFEENKIIYNKKSYPLTSRGELWINFTDDERPFRYLPAIDILQNASQYREELENAFVFVAATATGINDIRSFPLDPAAPGVEGHAWMLDNFLSDQVIRTLPEKEDLIVFATFAVIFLLFSALLFIQSSGLLLLGIFGLLALLLTVDLSLFFGPLIHLNFWLAYAQMGLLGATVLTVRYISEEKEKRFIKGAFGRYVSPKVVDEIVKNPDLLKLGGEKREMSIFFSDIRSFTSFSERLDPAQLANFLNDYLTLMTDIIVKEFDGTLDKYIGDAIMAFWNAPLSQTNHKTLAVRAAMKMQAVLRENFDRFKKDYGVECRTGIGINSGFCVAGNMGSQMNFNYTVIGDTVNLASRVEGLTKFYGVETLITANTRNDLEIEDRFLRSLDRVQVKGKKEAVELIEVRDLPFDETFLKDFASARNFYLNREFEQAKEAFTTLAQSSSTGDRASELFKERSDQFLKTPPPQEWDGSLEMRTK